MQNLFSREILRSSKSASQNFHRNDNCNISILVLVKSKYSCTRIVFPSSIGYSDFRVRVLRVSSTSAQKSVLEYEYSKNRNSNTNTQKSVLLKTRYSSTSTQKSVLENNYSKIGTRVRIFKNRYSRTTTQQSVLEDYSKIGTGVRVLKNRSVLEYKNCTAN